MTLRRRIWAPLAPHLVDARRVFVVPDGALNLVPLAALPSARGRYLLDDGPVIHYLAAERDLVTDGMAASTAGTGLLAIGGPSFNDGSSFAALLGTTPAKRGTDRSVMPSPAAPGQNSRAENHTRCITHADDEIELYPNARHRWQ